MYENKHKRNEHGLQKNCFDRNVETTESDRDLFPLSPECTSSHVDVNDNK